MDNTSGKSKTPKTIKRPGNFAEALLEIGGKKKKLTKETRSQKEEKKSGKVEHEWLQKKNKTERHKEVTSASIFNREQEEIKKAIKEIQEELKKLAKELAGIGSDIDKVVHQEIVNPGTYHLNFFEALRRYLVQLRKKASESGNWLDISQQRKQSQNKYWGGVKKSGTKFMLSSERTMATQAG
ncbi:DUF5660 family protein [Patescibacteria group bacterium]